MPDATPPPSFADLIATARRRRGWSQEDLEAESGVSRSTVSRWERGLSDKPEPEHVRAVCQALGIDPRKAAVALGYLTEQEVEPGGPRLAPDVEEVLEMLQDPAVSVGDKKQLIEYLRFLKLRAQGRLDVG